jgi:hypothetical protein
MQEIIQIGTPFFCDKGNKGTAISHPFVINFLDNRHQYFSMMNPVLRLVMPLTV